MIADKLRHYKLTPGIHTLQVRVRGYPLKTPTDTLIYNSVKQFQRTTKDGEVFTYLKINPSKINKVSCFSDCQRVISYVLSQYGLKENCETEVAIVRVDLALDSCESDFYRAYEKLHRYLISAIALAYKVKNCYRSVDLWKENTLSIAVKNRTFEIEAYDKDRESDGREATKARLELRSKDSRRFIKGIENEFMTHWRLRFARAIQSQNLKNVCTKYNDAIEDKWIADRKEVSQKYGSVKDLYLAYQNVIFTKEQLVDLVMRVEGLNESKARTRVENLKKHYPAQFEFFSQKNLQIATDTINKAIKSFFTNESVTDYYLVV